MTLNASFLQAHPTLTEHERKRLCRVMDCQKLSIDACMHAAQNERLPLRVVVQVLFSEQVKISNAIANSTLKDSDNLYQPLVSTRKQLLEGTPQSFQEGWATAKKDINTLKFELDSVKAKNLELQNDMDNLQRQFEKLAPCSKAASSNNNNINNNNNSNNNKQSSSSAWSSGWKKLGKLTKISGAEQQVMGDQNMVVEGAKKGPRRWRNSIS